MKKILQCLKFSNLITFGKLNLIDFSLELFYIGKIYHSIYDLSDHGAF